MSTLHDKLAAVKAVLENWMNLANAEDALRAAGAEFQKQVADEVAALVSAVDRLDARLADVESLLSSLAPDTVTVRGDSLPVAEIVAPVAEPAPAVEAPTDAGTGEASAPTTVVEASSPAEAPAAPAPAPEVSA